MNELIRSLTRILPILSLISCGTEVGNGKSGSESTEKTSGATSPKAATEAASPETMPSSKAPNTDSSLVYANEYFLLASCASPLAEKMEGTFSDLSRQHKVSVISTDVGAKTVSWTGGDQSYAVKVPLTQNPYEITSTPAGPTVSCGLVYTANMSGTRLQRLTNLSNGAELVWEIEAGAVVKVSIRFPPEIGIVLFKE